LDNRANGDPANDIKACKAYQADLLAAQLPQVANPSPLPLATLDANTFIDLKTGIAWRIGPSVTASCQRLWDNGGGHAFRVCSIPGNGRSGQPWQELPYVQDIQAMLNHSGCPTSGQSTCITDQGMPSAVNYFWADSNYSNVVDPSPKGDWHGNNDIGGVAQNWCDAMGCRCNNGDCYDWFNIIVQDDNEKPVANFPPCWTSAVGDPNPSGLLAWECGVVDTAAAGFNSVGQADSATSVYEWVGFTNGALKAPGVPFPSGFYWAGTPPFPAPYVPGSKAK
ncbi:MAG TPA: hypothetical protein VFS60_00935, partial [Thermoanaerobaculia bacterium]|nr:hypothetical protein [Thermoanaerobaculia bacterium]